MQNDFVIQFSSIGQIMEAVGKTMRHVILSRTFIANLDAEPFSSGGRLFPDITDDIK